MGGDYRFSCPACGYTAEVAGGVSTDLLERTHTVRCTECRELFDVVVAHRETTAVPYGPSAEICCPEDCDHEVTPWQHPGPCPRCEAVLARALALEDDLQGAS